MQVTAREGRPILVVEEGDTETAAWSEQVMEVPRSADTLSVSTYRVSQKRGDLKPA